jgi:hypothetical protein
MGAGFLALPSSFVHSGWLLGVGLLFLAALLLVTTGLLEGEIILRCTALMHVEALSASRTSPVDRPSGRDTELAPLGLGLGTTNGGQYASVSRVDSFPPRVDSFNAKSGFTRDETLALLARCRSVSMTEVCELLLGPGSKLLYCAVITAYQVGTLWGYASVFGEAAAGLLPLPFVHDACDVYGALHGALADEEGCLALYRGWVVVFAVVVMPLCLVDVREQVARSYCEKLPNQTILPYNTFRPLCAHTCCIHTRQAFKWP